METFLAINPDDDGWNHFPHAKEEADNAVAELKDPNTRKRAFEQALDRVDVLEAQRWNTTNRVRGALNGALLPYLESVDDAVLWGHGDAAVREKHEKLIQLIRCLSQAKEVRQKMARSMAPPGMEFATWLDRLGTVAGETYMDEETKTTVPFAVPAFNGPCFFSASSSPVIRDGWSFGDFKIRPEVTQPQTKVQTTSINEIVVHATHFKSFLDMTAGEKHVALKGQHPLQYRSNRRLVWFAADPGKVLQGHSVCGGKSRYGRVVIKFHLDKLKALLQKIGVASVFKLGTRLYAKESCHTFIVAEGETVQTATAAHSKETVTLSKEAEWPAEWKWRWNVNVNYNTPAEFDQVDIAVALPKAFEELKIPLDTVASIELLDETKHGACVKGGRLNKGCSEKESDSKLVSDVRQRLKALRDNSGIKIIGLDSNPE